ncbi:flippase-like domain-containing protein [Verrucomicrobia bacterium]|nr:flippase-like domain-containing protein [Verrucomicrobiota bacterium]
MGKDKTRGKQLAVAAKLILSLFLLFWISHSIFMEESRLHWEDSSLAWEDLNRGAKWSNAWTTGPDLLVRTISQVSPTAFALSVILMGITILIGILRWRMALAAQGLPLPFWRATEITFVAQFFNSFLLGSTGGDIIKAWYAARESHHKKSEAVVTVVADRIIGLFSMLVFAVIAASLNSALFKATPAAGGVLLLVCCLLGASTIILWFAFWHPLEDQSIAAGLINRFPAAAAIIKSLQSCREFSRRPNFLIKAFSLSTLLNVICVFQFLTLSNGLGMNVSLTAFLFVVPAVICVSALPITPNGLGIRENLVVLMLTSTAVGADGATALSLSLLAYGGSLLWSVAGGFVYLAFKAPHHLKDFSDSSEV